MTLRKIIRMIKAMARGLLLTLRVSRPVSSSSIEQKQPDSNESSKAGEGTTVAANNLSDNFLHCQSPESSSGSEESMSDETRSDDIHVMDDQDGALCEAPVEQPSLGSGESCESGNVEEGGNASHFGSENSEFPASYYRTPSKISLDTTQDTFQKPSPSFKQIAGDNLDVRYFNADGNALSPRGSTETPSEPKKSRKKVPRSIGSRRTSQVARQESTPQLPAQQHPLVFHPELICRRTLGSAWQWEVVLAADDECPVLEVRQNGESMDMADGQCTLESYACPLQIVFDRDEQIEFPMFDGEPLIFKLRKGWTGDGRRVGGITKGYFIVIVPSDWKSTGRFPVEPEGCADPNFTAHYFFRNGDKPMEDIGGFEEYEISFSNSFELEGERVFDDSEEGDLFVGVAPKLTVNSGVEWVRVGEERKGGWKGENFKPSEWSLAEMLGSRQGRFFIRVFNSEAKRLESGEFRYLRDLREILVNDEQYTENTLLGPSSEGHSPTRIRFVGINGAVIVPNLSAEAKHVDAREGDLVIAPHPDADYVSGTLEAGSESINTLLDLPRVWWRLERDGSEPCEWCDKPLVMMREEFRNEINSSAAIQLRLPRRIRSVRVGFDEERDQEYRSRIKEKDGTEIPLSDFVDYSQVDQHLNKDAFLNMQCDGVVLTLIRISADPVPAIISFTCTPVVLSAGEKATLRWETKNTEAVSISIDPGIGAVETNGTLEVMPCETTTYVLRLKSPGMDDVKESVTVKFLPLHDEKPVALVRRGGGGWRHGKGFSLRELRALGLTAADVSPWSISVDKHRRSTHQANIDTIRRLINS